MSESTGSFDPNQPPHAAFSSLAGQWAGTARTWFEPGVLADTSPIQGTLEPILGGRFLLHRYQGSLGGKPIEGIAIHGYSRERGACRTVWADTFHNGTDLLFQTGTAEDGALLSAVGEYAEDQNGPWRWRTAIVVPAADQVVISHFNVPPGQPEALAVEIDYHRR